MVKKWYSLADKVWHPSNLAKAAAAVLANHGAAGLDHQSCVQFGEHLADELAALGLALREHRYRPQPVRRVYIPKPGKPDQRRPLGIPAVRDRVVQQAVRQVLEPIWEPTFSDTSYGFRPGRSAHDAVNRLYDALTSGYHWVVDADIQDYFGSIDHTLLIDQIAERVSDGTVLRWLQDMLRAGVLAEGQIRPTLRGTPQGGVASPLFGNIYLDALDRAMEVLPEVIYLRYADDWCALARTQEAAEQALQVARGVVHDRLHLTLHPEKTRILDARVTPFDFLGFTFFWTNPGDTGRPLFGPKSAATERLKDRVRVLTRRKRPASLNMVIQDLAPVIRGWGQYFTISQHGEYYRLDAWIRERCRAFVAKRWNRSRALDRVWTNQRLADLGLPSLAAMRRKVLAQPPRP